MKTIFKVWLLLAIVLSGLVGLVYASAQQVLRLDANDPQIQLAEDAATRLAHGDPVQNVVPTEKVDIAQSLAPYLIVFDDVGQPLASSAQLDGQIPTLPAGVFVYVRQNGEDRITWQPQPGVRSAVIVMRFQGANAGFVVAGRSLREVEMREDALLKLDLAGWVAILLASFVVSLALAFFGSPSGEMGKKSAGSVAPLHD